MSAPERGDTVKMERFQIKQNVPNLKCTLQFPVAIEFNLDWIKWISLVSACTLVFGVQLGVQTLPNLLSGELFPSDVRPTCKSIARSIQCVFLVCCLKVCHFYYITSEIQQA